MEHRSGCWGGTAHAQDINSLKFVNDGDIRLPATADSSPHRNGTGSTLYGSIAKCHSRLRRIGHR